MSFPVVLFVLTVRLPTMVSMSRPRTSLPPTLLVDIFVRFVLSPVADPGMDLLNLTLQLAPRLLPSFEWLLLYFSAAALHFRSSYLYSGAGTLTTLQ